jgi:RHS repeat-associated protein
MKPLFSIHAGSGTSDLSFTGMNQDTSSGLYDFPAREYETSGRWPSPDPAGMAAVDPSDPHVGRCRYTLHARELRNTIGRWSNLPRCGMPKAFKSYHSMC